MNKMMMPELVGEAGEAVALASLIPASLRSLSKKIWERLELCKSYLYIAHCFNALQTILPLNECQDCQRCSRPEPRICLPIMPLTKYWSGERTNTEISTYKFRRQQWSEIGSRRATKGNGEG